MIDEERKEWGHLQESRRSTAELIPTLRGMIDPTTTDSQIAQKIAGRLADRMIQMGVDPKDERAVKRMVVMMAQKAEPLGLGRIHPVLRAYAYAQALKHGGAL